MVAQQNLKPNLILVDDHLIFRQGLKDMITIENIAAVIGEASNGVEFLKLLPTQKPDLVLMDIGLPFYSGFYWTNELRKLSQIPIIFISSASDDMNQVTAMNQGADDIWFPVYSWPFFDYLIDNACGGN